MAKGLVAVIARDKANGQFRPGSPLKPSTSPQKLDMDIHVHESYGSDDRWDKEERARLEKKIKLLGGKIKMFDPEKAAAVVRQELADTLEDYKDQLRRFNRRKRATL